MQMKLRIKSIILRIVYAMIEIKIDYLYLYMKTSLNNSMLLLDI